MEAASGHRRTYTQCNPRCEWIKVGELDTLLVDVSGLGFKQEELKVLVDTSRKLKISGERAVKGDQWSRFLQTFQLPKGCNVTEVQASFDKDVLCVLLPKPVASAKDGEEGGVLKALSMRRTQVVTAVVAILIAAGLGTYAAYKFDYL